MLLGAAAGAAAQPAIPPGADPSVILRQQQQQPAQPPAPPPSRAPLAAPERDGTDRSGVPQGDVRFVLQRVEFTPSGLLPQAVLDAVWQPLAGQEIGLGEIRRIIAAVNETYWANGHYAAQATLPAQRITGGVVKVSLVEGRVAGLAVDGGDRKVTQLAESVFALTPGELFQGPQLQERLARFNRASDTRFYAVLKPGADPGTTDVRAQVEMPKRYEAAVSLHNEASDSVGRNQVEFTGLSRRLLTGADRASAILQKGKGSTNLSLLYSTPINAKGTRVGANFSTGRTRTVGGGLAGLQVEGESRVFGLTLTHPLPSWGGLELDASLGLQSTRSETEIAGFSLGEAKTSNRTLAVQAVHRGQRHVANAYLATNSASYQPSFGASRSVGYIFASGSYAWFMDESWYFTARGALQRTSEKDIPGNLKFSLGNASDVRGYPASSVFGDKGHYLLLEAHRRFGSGGDGFVFYDMGKTESASLPEQKLASVGFGASMAFGPNLTGSASIARPTKTVVPDQSGTRLLFRLTWQIL